MAVAQAIETQYKIVKQSGLGVPGSSGSTRLRRTAGAAFLLARQTYQNNEIVDHQQSTGSTAGVGQTSGLGEVPGANDILSGPSCCTLIGSKPEPQ